jgi:hypothetical protein
MKDECGLSSTLQVDELFNCLRDKTSEHPSSTAPPVFLSMSVRRTYATASTTPKKYVAHYRFPRTKFTKRSAVSGADPRP